MRVMGEKYIASIKAHLISIALTREHVHTKLMWFECVKKNGINFGIHLRF